MTTRKSLTKNVARMGVSMAALAGVGITDAALAQTDEIVVTAQFREQNVQDTPLAVTAVSGDMLNRRSQTELSEVARQAPNVTLAGQNQEYGSAMIAYIRGIGQNDPNFAVEPGVGIYIDDVYLPTLTGSLLDLMDVDRVEVLRGPQGTLAGRNSIGGAIKMYSVKPQGDNSGSLQVTYGSYDRIDVRGIYDIPLTEDLAMRVSAVSKNEDGYIKRLDYNLTHPGTNVPTQAPDNDPVLGTLGGHSIAAGKIAFRWTPNDRLDVNLSGDYTRERNEAGVATLQYANAEGLMNADPDRPWLTGTDGAAIPYNCMFVPHGVNSCDTQTQFDGRYITYATFNDLYPGDSQQPYKPFALDPHRDMDNYGAALTINYELSDTLSVYSITSYRKYETDWSYDVDGSPLAPNILNQNQTNEQISQEIRLNGTLADNFIDFTLGGFFFDTEGFYTARVDLPYAGIDFIHGPDPTPSNNKAVFGNVTFNFSDAFHLTGGVRQSWDKKEYQYFRHNPDYTDIEGPCPFILEIGPFLADPINNPPPSSNSPTDIGNQPNCLLFGINGTEATFKNDRLDWRVAADYRFNDALMVYGQIATGYRAGGFNARPFFPSQATPHVPETIRSYEIGFKSDLFDDTLRLNVAGFYFPYDNIVLNSTFCADLPPGQQVPCLRPSNVGSAKVKGFEAEAFFYPTRNFSIDASLSYLDFQYKEIDETAGTGVALGDVTPYTPEWQYSFGAQYDIQNVFGGELSVRFDGSYQSEIFTEAGNVRQRFIPSDVVADSMEYPDIGLNGGGGPIPVLEANNLIDGYFLGNARLMWNSGDGDWGLAFEVKNVFDKYYFTTKVNDVQAVSNVYGSPGKPRTWALTLKRNF